jgi:hypothetical protein
MPDSETMLVQELGNVGSFTPAGMSSDVVLDMLGTDAEGNVGSFTPAGMSSDVVLDMLGTDAEGNVGSFTPEGMSSEVLLSVALTIGMLMYRDRIAAERKDISKIVSIREELCKITNNIFSL